MPRQFGRMTMKLKDLRSELYALSKEVTTETARKHSIALSGIRYRKLLRLLAKHNEKSKDATTSVKTKPKSKSVKTKLKLKSVKIKPKSKR